MKYDIKKLRTDRNYFDEFKDLLPNEWHKHIHNVDTFMYYFDRKDESREIYYEGFDYDTSDKDIHDRFKSDELELKAYAKVVSNITTIALYGTCYLEEWDEDSEQYMSASFGNYDYIEIY